MLQIQSMMGSILSAVEMVKVCMLGRVQIGAMLY
jgi:hypothetical protein